MPLNPEHILLPFSPSKLPLGPWLVFAPHADDETLGMGGSLLKANSQGIETHLVVMTDGALGSEQTEFVEVRWQEVQAVGELLGLNSLQGWSEPDRSL